MAVVELQMNSVAWSPSERVMAIVTPSWLEEPEDGGGSNLVSWRKPWSAQDGLSDAGVGVPAAAYPYASTTAATAVRATVKSADRFFIPNREMLCAWSRRQARLCTVSLSGHGSRTGSTPEGLRHRSAEPNLAGVSHSCRRSPRNGTRSEPLGERTTRAFRSSRSSFG